MAPDDDARPDEAADESAVTLGAGTPETLASASEDADTIGSVLRVLPAADRHLIDLAYFKGFTHSEIAGKLQPDHFPHLFGPNGDQPLARRIIRAKYRP